MRIPPPKRVRHALMAINHHLPGGQVFPVDALRARVTTLVDAHCRCDQTGDVGAALPALMRDLHSSITAGRDVAELLDLAILLHTQVTVGWLRVVGASSDLRWQAAVLAHDAAQDRDTPTALGVALWGGLYVMIGAGTFDLALAGLDAVTVPTNTPESMQLAGTLALSRSLLAAVDSRPEDVEAPFQQAVELAERTGEGNAYGNGLWAHQCRPVAHVRAARRLRLRAGRPRRGGSAPGSTPPSPGAGRLLGQLRPCAGAGSGTPRRRHRGLPARRGDFTPPPGSTGIRSPRM